MWDNPHAIFVLLWSPFVLQLFLGGFNTGVSGENVSVEAEVCNLVVSWCALGVLLWGPNVLELLLGIFDVLLGSNDISIYTKVRDEIANLCWGIPFSTGELWSNKGGSV